jgi:hypothetical protein
LKHSFALATTISAIGNEDVAAGLGAFRTCKIRFLRSPVLTVSKTKSSTRFPSADKACARTPLGPLNTKKKIFSFLKNILYNNYRSTSFTVRAGTNFCNSLTVADNE